MKLRCFLSFFLASAASRLPFTAALYTTNKTCKYVPQDHGWPGELEWGRLNATVAGRLIATVPVASVCHDNGPFAAYDETACATLRQGFDDAGAQTLCPIPGEIFNPYWQNQTCSPFTEADAPCQLGNRPVYSIDVNGPADVTAGLDFALRNNIRLVIRNTGIDYLGASTGHGSLALWTANLKSINITAGYQSPQYSGPAMRLGAGVIGGEAYEAARQAGYRYVGPECGLVGVVGGYAQGGGQSQLVTAYGLAADQVLEWEVVTPKGEYLIATPEDNADLYWALTGGGGGTYAVVLSATFRIFDEGLIGGGQMVVQSNDTDNFWEAVDIWYSQAPSYVDDTKNNIQSILSNDTLTIFSFTMPDQNTSSIDDLLSAYTPELNRLNISYILSTSEYASYFDSYVASYGPLPYGNLCPNYPIIASRLIPRSTVLSPDTRKGLVDLFRNITEDGTWTVGCSFLSVDDAAGSVRPAHPPNAVLPAWRDAFAYCNPQHDEYDWEDLNLDRDLRRKLTGEILPMLEAATPGGGLLSETDPTYEGDWKKNFYGGNYERLLSIKHKYDPNYLMYGKLAVGSDEFQLDGDGRLCRS